MTANIAFLDLGNNQASGGSQRSSLFPWDNARQSSSSGFAATVGGDHVIEPVDVRLRSSSLSSRRESSLAHSQRGSVLCGLTFSPVVGKDSSHIGEDFAFEGQLYRNARRISCDFVIGFSGQSVCPGRHSTRDPAIGIKRSHFGKEFSQLFRVKISYFVFLFKFTDDLQIR